MTSPPPDTLNKRRAPEAAAMTTRVIETPPTKTDSQHRFNLPHRSSPRRLPSCPALQNVKDPKASFDTSSQHRFKLPPRSSHRILPSCPTLHKPKEQSASVDNSSSQHRFKCPRRSSPRRLPSCPTLQRQKPSALFETSESFSTIGMAGDSSPRSSLLENLSPQDTKDEQSDRSRMDRKWSAKSLARGWFDPGKGTVSLDYMCNGTAPCRTPKQVLHPFLSGKSISASPMLEESKKKKLGKVMGALLDSHSDYYEDPERLAFLEAGGVFFSFTCRTHEYLEPYERDMVEAIANLSSFEDESKENFVPDFDINDLSDLKLYTFVLQKSAYLLPGVQLEVLTPELLSSARYHKKCQPRGTKIWVDVREDTTFRMTKPIIRHVYNMTIQFKVSMVGQADLEKLTQLMGVRVDCGILMERTKRHKVPKPDSTAKAKSILLYTEVPGGVLVTHATVILNTAIPVVVAKVITSLGSMGLSETIETAERTREHLLSLM